jgi:hypothetical protein
LRGWGLKPCPLIASGDPMKILLLIVALLFLVGPALWDFFSSMGITDNADEEIEELLKDAKYWSEYSEAYYNKRYNALLQLDRFHREDPRTAYQIRWSARKDHNGRVRGLANDLLDSGKYNA